MHPDPMMQKQIAILLMFFQIFFYIRHFIKKKKFSIFFCYFWEGSVWPMQKYAF